MRSLDERFDEKWMPEPMSGCWLWLGSKNGAGYGTIERDGRTFMAHRYSYERAVGPIPEGLVLDHLCRTPSCVNPEHLEAVTHGENILRGREAIADGALPQRRRTHCAKGHVLRGENVSVGEDGIKRCRQCQMLRCARIRSLTPAARWRAWGYR